MPTINVSDEIYQRAVQKAVAMNQTVDHFVEDVIRRTVPPPRLTPEQVAEKLKAVERFLEKAKAFSAHLPPGHVVDCDRESIYREREDAQL